MGPNYNLLLEPAFEGIPPIARLVIPARPGRLVFVIMAIPGVERCLNLLDASKLDYTITTFPTEVAFCNSPEC